MSHILALATATPKHSLPQHEIAERMVRLFGLTGLRATKLRKLYAGTAIEKRHSVLSDFGEEDEKCSFLGKQSPSITERNQIYKQEAPKLAFQAVEQLFEAYPLENKTKITHVISVSCTGVVAPGIEFDLVERLQLKSNVERFGVNFMGCFGAFKGIALGHALASLNPENRVLVVCTELCSLHLQNDLSMESIISNALFADGAAAVLIGIPKNNQPLWEIVKTASCAIPNTRSHMGWELGETHFLMRLSKEVPSILAQEILPFIEHAVQDLPKDELTFAIHPGGKQILEKCEQMLQLPSKALMASWEVLKNYGNISSATFLFVLEELLKQKSTKPWTLGLGMGPGLSIEGILLKNVS